jgi:hypothetical protein
VEFGCAILLMGILYSVTLQNITLQSVIHLNVAATEKKVLQHSLSSQKTFDMPQIFLYQMRMLTLIKKGVVRSRLLFVS